MAASVARARWVAVSVILGRDARRSPAPVRAPLMGAEFNWWLLIVGVVAGGALTWLVLADFARRDREISDEELAAEAAWIARTLDTPLLDADLAEEVLRAHRRYLGFPPPDVLVAPEELPALAEDGVSAEPPADDGRGGRHRPCRPGSGAGRGGRGRAPTDLIAAPCAVDEPGVAGRPAGRGAGSEARPSGPGRCRGRRPRARSTRRTRRPEAGPRGRRPGLPRSTGRPPGTCGRSVRGSRPPPPSSRTPGPARSAGGPWRPSPARRSTARTGASRRRPGASAVGDERDPGRVGLRLDADRGLRRLREQCGLALRSLSSCARDGRTREVPGAQRHDRDRGRGGDPREAQRTGGHAGRRRPGLVRAPWSRPPGTADGAAGCPSACDAAPPRGTPAARTYASVRARSAGSGCERMTSRAMDALRRMRAISATHDGQPAR